MMLMLLVLFNIHRVSKNVPPLDCYNFWYMWTDFDIFGRNVTDEV